MRATVTYKGFEAFYEIRKESAGIYYANLVYFEGDPDQCPPSGITLIRGIRQWTGSHEDEVLLNQLGKKIEEDLKAESE